MNQADLCTLIKKKKGVNKLKSTADQNLQKILVYLTRK